MSANDAMDATCRGHRNPPLVSLLGRRSRVNSDPRLHGARSSGSPAGHDGGPRSETSRPEQRKHAKSICKCEARALASGGRPVIVYHHNSRLPGGHEAEVRNWQEQFGEGTCAVRWRHISVRIFFILNCTEALATYARNWCERWDNPVVCFEGCPSGRTVRHGEHA